jgi:hypothetical protein
MWYQSPMARETVVTVARGESEASASDAEAARCDVVRAMSTEATEARRGCAEVMFEHNGINGVGSRNVRRVYTTEKELSVCRRGRV